VRGEDAEPSRRVVDVGDEHRAPVEAGRERPCDASAEVLEGHALALLRLVEHAFLAVLLVGQRQVERGGGRGGQRRRRREQVALAERDPELAHRVQLPSGLDAGRDDGRPVHGGHLEQRAQQRLGGEVALDAPRQRAAELDERGRRMPSRCRPSNPIALASMATRRPRGELRRQRLGEMLVLRARPGRR
jgi:hypothetical protein